MNEINKAVYNQLSLTIPKKRLPISTYRFFISQTDLRYEEYKDTPYFKKLLIKLGIKYDQFETEGKIPVLRCTMMNPWLKQTREKRIILNNLLRN